MMLLLQQNTISSTQHNAIKSPQTITTANRHINQQHSTAQNERRPISLPHVLLQMPVQRLQMPEQSTGRFSQTSSPPALRQLRLLALQMLQDSAGHFSQPTAQVQGLWDVEEPVLLQLSPSAATGSTTASSAACSLGRER